MEWYVWQGGRYWITPVRKRSPVVSLEVRIAYVSRWYAFLFPFHEGANAILQAVPKSDRYFFCEPVNAYRTFKGWLVSDRYFPSVKEQLEILEATIHYVVPEWDYLPLIPPPWVGMSFAPYWGK